MDASLVGMYLVDRQGMSVISAVNLSVENTIFSNTAGTAPAAGVDLEPDFPHEAMVNITFKGCACVGNAGGGFRRACRLQQASPTEPGVYI